MRQVSRRALAALLASAVGSGAFAQVPTPPAGGPVTPPAGSPTTPTLPTTPSG
jgi:hypothetical protein